MTSQEIQRTVRSFMERLQDLPLEDIIKNLDATLAEARVAVASLNVLIRDVDRRVDPIHMRNLLMGL